MADAFSFTNYSFASAAVPTLAATGDVEWDTRFAEWLTADGLARSDYQFGAYFKASANYDETQARLKSEHGLDYRACEKGKKDADIAWEKMNKAEDERASRYLSPMWEAAQQLAMTPAPNLAAALFKIEVVKREDLHMDRTMTVDPFTLVSADMARLREQMNRRA
jgi:hypothetical protein